ncbi:MAG: hypothetical protein MZW92_20360 [Comamonadaceae bacterium]|nr:hypothetical protein [Comamonadaceae bacterium]
MAQGRSIERLDREHLTASPTLVVLDNCEHVIDACGRPGGGACSARAAALTIVATSREGLGVAGEQIYPVRLAVAARDDGPRAPMQAAEVGAACSSTERSSRCPTSQVGAEQRARAIVEIRRRLDGIALAIELAAARVTMLAAEPTFATRLDDRFRLLTGGSRAMPRHQTLHAAMQWSYELLAPAEQHMLRQMAVFADGWTLQAAVDVAQTTDEYEALALLTALHDKSLLTVDRDVSAGRPRYRMLETVRQYALERLNACGEGEAARGRHVAHFIAMAEEAEPQVRGRDQDLWMGRFKQEHENLVAAMTWCCEGGLDPQAGLCLAAATGYYWGWNSVELGDRLTRAVLAHDGVAPATAAREGTLRLAGADERVPRALRRGAGLRTAGPGDRAAGGVRHAAWPGRSIRWAPRWGPWVASSRRFAPRRRRWGWRATRATACCCSPCSTTSRRTSTGPGGSMRPSAAIARR